MNNSETEVMSFPSDILSPEDQAALFEDISDIPNVNEMVHMFHEGPNPESDYIDEKDYKDETLFVTMPEAGQLTPPTISNILSNEEYLGPFKFEVCICPNGSKNPWVYSPSLNKIYMDMNSPFPVDFKINNRPQNPLYIRITPVFSLPQHSQDPVYRCINHEHRMEKSNRDVKENVRQHVIRCSNPSAIYLGDKSKNERLSVIIHLSQPQTGTDSVREIFQFVCKNSCPTPGMNRRPIEVIFTLEDQSGHVLGRQTLRVRICSCPKRDKEKEEKEHCDSVIPRGKKRKVEKPEKKTAPTSETDDKEYEVTLKIVGKQNVQQTMKFVRDLMAGEILKPENKDKDMTKYKNCFNELYSLKNKYSDC